MMLDAFTGFAGFKFIDDATGQEVKDVLWVDDHTLEYAVMKTRSFFDMAAGLELDTEVFKVTRVRVDYVLSEVHFNEPPQPAAPERKLHPCGECRQAECCRRIDWCAQYRTAFGEARLP